MTQVAGVHLMAIEHGQIPATDSAQSLVPFEASVDGLECMSERCEIHAGMDSA
jgi:hypothetical protein